MFQERINSLTTIEIVLWLIFLSVIIIQQVYWWLSYRKLLFSPKEVAKPSSTSTLVPVSVIICAKNEATNLERFLPHVLEQDYPKFQVVVVNDCSEDHSEEVLERFSQQYKHLYFTNVKQDPIYRHGKKLAITLGIKAAKYEHLVFTDADCIPDSKEWLRQMAAPFSDKVQLVLGVSPYQRKKGFLNQVIAYETLQTAISYISSAMLGSAYMGVGRNMAYTKQLFYDNKGFSGHTHILSGDDDLFVNKAATPDNTATVYSIGSSVHSVPEAHWGEWIKQKRRHMTTGPLYKRKFKMRFAFEGAMGFIFYALLITLLTLFSEPLFIAAAFVIRYILKGLIYRIASQKMHFGKSYFVEGLWLDIFVPLIRAAILIINTIKPQRFTWR